MNAAIKEAEVKKYYYKTHDSLKEHLQCVVDAYNFSKRFMGLKGLNVFDCINYCWNKEPDRFVKKSAHRFAGLHN